MKKENTLSEKEMKMGRHLRPVYAKKDVKQFIKEILDEIDNLIEDNKIDLFRKKFGKKVFGKYDFRFLMGCSNCVENKKMLNDLMKDKELILIQEKAQLKIIKEIKQIIKQKAGFKELE